MTRSLALKEAWLLAAEWGSYMHSGDPGAVFYSLSETSGIKDQQHREKLLEAIDAQLLIVEEALRRGTASKYDWTEKDADDLRSLREWAQNAVIVGELDEFTRAYITAALWSSNDESDDAGGEPMDANYDIHDLAADTLEEMKQDCAKFQQENAKLLAGLDAGQCGHDFWLTRNGHGAGFWDRGYGKKGDRLTEICEEWGEVTLLVGDDRKIYTM